MDKEQLRRGLRKCLLAMPSQHRTEKSKKACQNLISTPQFQSVTVIMMYLPLPHEADISEAILHAWQLGKEVCVPMISWSKCSITPVRINSLETGPDLNTGIAGLRNPVTGAPMSFEEIELVVAPALGFDRKGNRLGRGGSYYDRFFANAKLKASRCGFGFTEQLVETIPVAEHDEPVYILVTDEEIIYIKGTCETGTQ